MDPTARCGWLVMLTRQDGKVVIVRACQSQISSEIQVVNVWQKNKCTGRKSDDLAWRVRQSIEGIRHGKWMGEAQDFHTGDWGLSRVWVIDRVYMHIIFRFLCLFQKHNIHTKLHTWLMKINIPQLCILPLTCLNMLFITSKYGKV